MPQSQPSIRASLFHSNLEALEALGAPAAKQVRARMPDVLREVQGSLRVAWLPIEYDVELTETVGRELGRETMRAWSRNGIVHATEGPLLSPVIRSARAIFGMTPHAILRRVPQGWSLCFRGCGTAEYRYEGERSCTVRILDAPDFYAQHLAYLDGIAGALEGLIVVGGGDGFVRADIDPVTRGPRFAFSW